MQIVLGSSSVTRKHVLDKAGWAYSSMSADIDEKSIRSHDPLELTRLLALAKAAAIIPQVTLPSIIITADQVVRCNGELREKPVSAEEAKYFLRSYAQYPAECINGVVVTNTATGKQVVDNQTSVVHFKTIPDEVIAQVILAGVVYQSAGGFSLENTLLEPYIIKIEGSYDGVLGLPLDVVERLVSRVS